MEVLSLQAIYLIKAFQHHRLLAVVPTRLSPELIQTPQVRLLIEAFLPPFSAFLLVRFIIICLCIKNRFRLSASTLFYLSLFYHDFSSFVRFCPRPLSRFYLELDYLTMRFCRTGKSLILRRRP